MNNKASHRSLRLFVVHAWSIIQHFYKWGLFNNKKVKIVNNKFDNYLN